MAKIITYNVNGIRAALRKGWMQWLLAASPDVICLQEIKANTDQLELEAFAQAGYQAHWFSAQKKGYSGTAILSKIEPDKVVAGAGMDRSDAEGRVLRADFGDLSVLSVYVPSGSSGEERQGFKIEWLAGFYDHVKNLKQERPNLIISGDYNICHKAIDIHNPVANKNASGFLPEERHWMDEFLELGFIDSFRHFNPEPHQYTWWSYRANARARNLGWRIDYNMVTNSMIPRLRRSAILTKAMHSDHCPVLLEIASK